MKNIQTKLFSAVALSILLSACSNTPHEAPEIINARPLSPYHVVKKGETLAEIASKHSMTENELIEMNNFKDPYKVFSGQRILVRVANAQHGDYMSPASSITVKELDDPSQAISDQKLVEVAPFSSTQKIDTLTPEDIGDDVISQLDVIPVETETLKINKAESTPAASTPNAEFDWPVKGNILAKFGQKLPDGTLSDSIQIGAPVDTKVKAAAAGKVQKAGEVSGFGRIVVVKHANGTSSVYTYLKEVSVKVGQKIEQGHVVGRVGKNGNKPTLLFQMRKLAGKKSVPVDPMKYLP